MGRENIEGTTAVGEQAPNPVSQNCVKPSLSVQQKTNIVEEGLRNADNLQKKSGTQDSDTTKVTLKQLLRPSNARQNDAHDNDNYKENQNVPEDQPPKKTIQNRENVGTKEKPDENHIVEKNDGEGKVDTSKTNPEVTTITDVEVTSEVKAQVEQKPE